MPAREYYSNLLASPFADELTLAFARAAVQGERLGGRGVPDILTVSLSSHDVVNRAFDPESRLSQDHLLQLDRHLQSFFRFLDAQLGADNYLLALTADHGFTDTPEWSTTQGRDAGRLMGAQALRSVNTRLLERFGVAKLAKSFSAAGLLLDERLIAARGLNRAEVLDTARLALADQPGVAAVFTREQLLGADTTLPYLAAMRRSFDPTRAAPLQFVLEPYWIANYRTGGSSHGSPYGYDTHVPLLLWDPAYVGQGEETRRVEVADLAPTLAALLGLPAPAQAQGHDLRPRP